MKKVIGIDLGGTSVLGGVIDEDGRILKKASRDTSLLNNRIDVLNQIKDVIHELLDGDILGIGIGSPGFIDSENGRVLEVGGNIKGWANTDIRLVLKKSFPDLPIFVENDANVAAICEHWIGGAKNFKSFLMITLGTGVGGGIYLEKEGILKGENYQAGEFGHAILYPFGKKCTCGQNGCVEMYISGTAIERIYREKSNKKNKGKAIFRDKDDKIAKEVVDEFVNNLSVYLVSLKNLFDPEGIVIGGGVINSREFWWDDMLNKYKEFSNSQDTMKILPAIYLNNAGMIGAGKIVFDGIRNYKNNDMDNLR